MVPRGRFELPNPYENGCLIGLSTLDLESVAVDRLATSAWFAGYFLLNIAVLAKNVIVLLETSAFQLVSR
jgi:hypothetical protein